jgi:hypothetical protein
MGETESKENVDSIPFINDEKKALIVRSIGILILIIVIVQNITFILMDKIDSLLYTTFLTTLLIGLTLIYQFDSVFLNTLTSLTFMGFIHISILFIPAAKSIEKVLGGVIYHSLIAIFQSILVFHKKIKISKKYLLWGFVFYLAFFNGYDTFARWNEIVGLNILISTKSTQTYAFYTLIFSAVFIYYYKKKYNVLAE